MHAKLVWNVQIGTSVCVASFTFLAGASVLTAGLLLCCACADPAAGVPVGNCEKVDPTAMDAKGTPSPHMTKPSIPTSQASNIKSQVRPALLCSLIEGTAEGWMCLLGHGACCVTGLAGSGPAARASINDWHLLQPSLKLRGCM